MRKFVDLHTHSTASDGTCPPEEIVRLADAERLAAVALTDHDTTDGLAAAREAARGLPDLRFVGGLEISAKFPTGVLHILGLGIDERSAGLSEALKRLRSARDARNPKVVWRLQRLGMAITMDDVRAVARLRRAGRDGEIISRLHIAEAMRLKGLVSSTDEAFEKYLTAGAPAYVRRERLPPPEAIQLIRDAGAVAALAHPTQLNCPDYPALERILEWLISFGLEGLEVWHPDHTEAQTRAYLGLARRYGLVTVGGSDYHGTAKATVLGRPRVPLAAAATGRLRNELLDGP